MSLDYIQQGDGQGQTLMLAENKEATLYIGTNLQGPPLPNDPSIFPPRPSINDMGFGINLGFLNGGQFDIVANPQQGPPLLPGELSIHDESVQPPVAVVTSIVRPFTSGSMKYFAWIFPVIVAGAESSLSATLA